MGRTSDARQRLMDAASELIWEYSYGAVTIEAICERARVKKGSFYYFFDSKSELAVVALDAWWAERKAVMDRIFRPENPPMARIPEYIDYVVQRQINSYHVSGQILGCPIAGLGAEIATQDEEIRTRVLGTLKGIISYFEQTIREIQALGLIGKVDAPQKAKGALCYYAGVLNQARIENNPDILRPLADEIMALIGVATPPAFLISAAPVPGLESSL